MQIIKRIPVKQILTETSRQALKDRFNKKYDQLDNESQQLQFEQKKIERNKEFNQNEVRQRFNKEIRLRRERMKRLQYQLNQLETLSNGEELKVDEVETLINVEEGDHYEELLGDRQIVIKDGIVIRAR
ncbi:YlqD family protein [Halobacillus sp. A5]|uniref:YlqD family protein n=1 Tax=Halobacillus sp. A5 TaxID=2880263 RepID=UPI0020A6B230|nr:YlqD family protein [Halobacillus sp. A5]MCP3026145.1 YlqD family protein [Halobacillus sp. A5]